MYDNILVFALVFYFAELATETLELYHSPQKAPASYS